MTPALTPLRPIARRALAAQSDERLVRLLREGHDPAFEEIVRRYRGPLVAFAAAIVPSERSEDVVQGALAKAHRAILADDREIVLRPWLFAIVRNGALNAIRGEPRVAELDSHESQLAGAPEPSRIAEQREDLDRLVVAICALPDAQRQALVKRELEGVGHGEIAAQLGTTATAVRGLIFRARTTLRDAVGAVLPLPVIRLLLTEAPAIGIGGGTGAALLGGGGAKAGTAIAAAVVALGTGIAIDRGSDRTREEASGLTREATGFEDAGARAGRESIASGPIAPARAGEATRHRDDSAGMGEDSEAGGGDDGGGGPGPGSGDDSAASTSGEGGDDSSSSGPGSGDGGGDGGGGDSSGPGDGTERSGDDGSSGSGSGTGGSDSGSDSSGPGPGTDTSGSGSGDSESGSDSSGSGSGDSGSGSGTSGTDGSGSGGSGDDDILPRIAEQSEDDVSTSGPGGG